MYAGVNVIVGEFCIINEKFDPSLKDETATDFQQLAAQITQQVDINIIHILLKLLLARPSLLLKSFFTLVGVLKVIINQHIKAGG